MRVVSVCRFRRRGGSAQGGRRSSFRSRQVWAEILPMMSARMVRASIFWMRQIEKERRVGVTPGRGGRVQDFPGHVFGEKVGDELSVEPSSRKIGVFGGQLVEAKEALHALEGEFDLPASAVEGEDVGCGEGALFERGDEEDELGRL